MLLDFLKIAAAIVLLLGTVIAVFSARRWWKKSENAMLVREFATGYRSFDSLLKAWGKPPQESKAPPSREDALTAVQQNAAIDLEFDEQDELTVVAKVTLQPQTQRNGNKTWVPKTPEEEEPSHGVVLANGTWILRVPSRERGLPIWLSGHVIAHSSKPLTDILMGTEERPGPAKRFKNRGQDYTDPEEFRLSIIPQRCFTKVPEHYERLEFGIVDLGAFRASFEMDDCPEIRKRDLLFTITAVNGKDWLVYLDARKDFASGLGALLLLKEFDPSVEIRQLL